MLEKQIKFFIKNGYCKINLFNKSEFNYLCNKVINKINKKITKKGKKLKLENIKNYHKYDVESYHEKIIKSSTRYLILDKKLIKPVITNKLIKKISKFYWGHSNFSIKWVGSLKEPLKNNATGFRIARPLKNSKKDVGGEHLDLHYGGENNINQKKLFTLWCPIVGMSNKYTLRISPRSHKKKHSLNSISRQKKFISKVLKKSYVQKFKFIRPKLSPGQVIFFHPNLIHGSSVNLGEKTRVSIDLRIFNKTYIN